VRLLSAGFEFELAEASKKLVDRILHVKPGEEVVITADSGSDWRVVSATAQAVKLAGGKPLVLWFNMARGVAMEAEKDIAVRSIRAALMEADVWIEFNRSWLLYSTIYEDVMKKGKTRYLILVGMTADMMVRLIGRVNLDVLFEFQKRLASIISRSHDFELKTAEGTNMVFKNDPSRPVLVEGEVTGPGDYALVGQVDWAPLEDSINGVFVVDGSIYPPEGLGVLRRPVRIYIEKGRITGIEGGREAEMFKTWLSKFNDPRMYNVAHIALGCNPNARLTGNILEDERVWGAVDWGFGSQAPTYKGKLGLAPSHTDAVALGATLVADGEYVLKDGEYVHPDLRELVKELKE
jgi:leucyl aminopeptidase (aminopeptidase T)